MDLLKKFVLWSYSRETSVYVIFCLLIVAFIFLTPKEWFQRSDSFATQTSRLYARDGTTLEQAQGTQILAFDAARSFVSVLRLEAA